MQEERLEPAVWLRGRLVGLRAPLRTDAAIPRAWHEGITIEPSAAETVLVSEERVPWGSNPVVRLMIVRLAGGQVIGSIILRRTDGRTSQVTLILNEVTMTERSAIQNDVLGLLVPYALDELALMTVTLRIAADDVSLMRSATRAGMREAVRLREAIVRPEGRVDLLIFERVNPAWGQRWRGGGDA